MSVLLEDGSTTGHLFPDDGGEYGGGYGIPRHVEHLDEACRRLGLPLLSGFVTVGDDGDPWFNPSDGLVCVLGLLGWLAGIDEVEQRQMAADNLWAQIGAILPEEYDELGPVVVSGVASDLRTFELELGYAGERKTRFQVYASF